MAYPRWGGCINIDGVYAMLVMSQMPPIFPVRLHAVGSFVTISKGVNPIAEYNGQLREMVAGVFGLVSASMHIYFTGCP